MLSGRHFILLGILACAGLLSVHDGQKQIEVCYQLGSIEKELRDIRSDIQLCKIKHRALQSPKAVIDRANALHLAVRPVNPDAQVLPLPTPPVIPSNPKPLNTVQIPHLPVMSSAVKPPQGH
jgi:hypothetical protein